MKLMIRPKYNMQNTDTIISARIAEETNRRMGAKINIDNSMGAGTYRKHPLGCNYCWLNLL